MRYRHIDGLRGALAVIVALSHVVGGFYDWASTRPLASAYLCVDLFFILSGFVLTPLLSDYTPCNFLKIRWLRLWPLHAITLTFVLIVLFNNKMHGIYTPEIWAKFKVIALNYLMLNDATGLTKAPMINDPAWSISVEMWVSGIWLPFCHKLRKPFLLAIAIVCYAVIFSHSHGLQNYSNIIPYIHAGMVRGVAGVTLGVYLFKIRSDIRVRLPHFIVNFAIIFIITICCLPEHFIYLDLAAITLTALVLINQGGSAGDAMAIAWLRSRLAQFLGAISFSLYITHSACIFFLLPVSYVPALGKAGAMLYSFGMVMIFSILTFFFIERPLHEWARLMSAGHRRRNERIASEKIFSC